MTYREKLTMEHPEFVGANLIGGCKGCPTTYGYVPEGSISEYKKARYWERFESFHAIVVPHDDGVTDGGDDLK